MTHTRNQAGNHAGSRAGRRRGCCAGLLDWPAMLRAGLLGLGLRPDQFWRLTPAEFLMMLGEGGGPAPLGRRRFEELLAAFPDQSQHSPE